MLDTEHYTLLLGLSAPWKVSEVTVAEAEQRVDVRAEHQPGARSPCPACGLLLPAYDHTPLRAWRHLDSCHYLTFLQAALPRVPCPRHGVRQTPAP
jgi:transposase